MAMGRGPGFWIVVGILVLVGPFVVMGLSRDQTDHQELCVRLLHLPEDAEFILTHGGWDEVGGRSAQAIVRLDPDQRRAWLARLDDPDIWRPVGFGFGRVAITEEDVPRRALSWDEGQRAFLTDTHALRWLDWGFIHRKPPQGIPTPWDMREARSFCLAATDGGQRVDACRAFPGAERGQRRPQLYLKAMVEPSSGIVHAHLRVF